MLGNKRYKTGIVGSPHYMPPAKQGLKPTIYSLANQQTSLDIPGTYLVGESARQNHLSPR